MAVDVVSAGSVSIAPLGIDDLEPPSVGDLNPDTWFEAYYPSNTPVEFVRFGHRNYDDGSSIRTHLDTTQLHEDAAVFIDITRADDSKLFYHKNDEGQWIEQDNGQTTNLGELPTILKMDEGGTYEWADQTATEAPKIRSWYRFQNVTADDTDWADYTSETRTTGDKNDSATIVTYNFYLEDGEDVTVIVAPDAFDYDIDTDATAEAFMDQFVKLPTGIRNRLGDATMKLTNTSANNIATVGFGQGGDLIDAVNWDVETLESLDYSNFQSVAIHETGHLLHGDFDDRFETMWIDAINADGNDPSQYATSYVSEDFAESFALWYLTMTSEENGALTDREVAVFGDRFANRFEIIENMDEAWDLADLRPQPAFESS